MTSLFAATLFHTLLYFNFIASYSVTRDSNTTSYFEIHEIKWTGKDIAMVK